MKKLLVSAVFFIILTTQLYAQTAFPFVYLPPDARHSGMGNIGVATAADASANFHNPAKLAFTDRDFGGNITRFAWLKDLVDGMYATNIAGYYKPKSGNQAIGVYYRAFNQGTVNFTTNAGQPYGTFSMLDQTIGVNYAKKIANNISLGIGLKYLNSKINGENTVVNGTDFKNANTLAGDIGVFGMVGKNDNFKLNYGIAVANIGGKVNYGRQDFNLPSNVRVGLSPTLQAAKSKIMFGAEVNKYFYNIPTSYSVGAEYSYNNYVFARVGYFNGNAAFANYISLGVGGRIIKQVGLDFAYRFGEGQPYNDTFQLSLVFDVKSFDKQVIKSL